MNQAVYTELARISSNSLYRLVNEIVHDNIRWYYDRFLDNTLDRMAENHVH